MSVLWCLNPDVLGMKTSFYPCGFIAFVSDLCICHAIAGLKKLDFSHSWKSLNKLDNLHAPVFRYILATVFSTCHMLFMKLLGLFDSLFHTKHFSSIHSKAGNINAFFSSIETTIKKYINSITFILKNKFLRGTAILEKITLFSHFSKIIFKAYHFLRMKNLIQNLMPSNNNFILRLCHLNSY